MMKNVREEGSKAGALPEMVKLCNNAMLYNNLKPIIIQNEHRNSFDVLSETFGVKSENKNLWKTKYPTME